MLERSEVRKGRRRTLNIVVHIQEAGEVTTGYACDVSRSGIFIRGTRVPALHAPLLMSFCLPDGDPRTIVVQGVVARIHSDPGHAGTSYGYGVGFANLPESTGSRIARFCGEVWPSRPSVPVIHSEGLPG